MDDELPVDELLLRMSGDPGKWQQQQQFLKVLNTPVVRTVVKALGVDVADLVSSDTDMRTTSAALLVAATEFGKFGWTVSPRVLKSTDYLEGVRLWQAHHDEAEVDEFLTRAWADRTWFRSAYGPMTTLAGKHGATLDLLLERNRLMHKALSHHEAGEYEASILIVLSQVDGLVLDFTESKFGFFVKGSAKSFLDQATVLGMPRFLATVFQSVIHEDNTTSATDKGFRRSPIMHGRYLAYGTETNSTKAFALMSGVLEWLKPRAEEVTARWQGEHEAKYAGSLERDADGKRLDRRGFSETRESLKWLAIRETNEHRNHGRYRADLDGMFPREGIGRMQRRDRTTLTVAPDGQSWWAWSRSDTSLVFGIGARDGEVTSFYYAEEDDPPGALGDDPRWVHEFDDRSPDWSGD
jgi:hypothetical protein